VTAYERTGFRDESISRRHREWGIDCPAVDVDLMLIEYDKGIPAALVDYKERHSSVPLVSQSANMKALGGLFNVNGQQLPFIVCYYDRETWAFKAHPMNARAVDIMCTDKPLELTENEWVKWLYFIRGRVVDSTIAASRQHIQWNERHTA